MEAALESGGSEPASPPGHARNRRRAGAAVAVTLAACAGAALLLRGGGRRADDVQAIEAKFDMLALAGELAQGLGASAKVLNDVKGLSADVSALGAPAEQEKAAVEKMNATSKLVNLTQMAALGPKDLLKPASEDRHDGNICPQDEEAHQGLCYKKCAVLTGGAYPIRTTAFACCQEEPCSFFNSKFTNPLFACTGFDTAGAAEGSGCPHFPGDCMPNEEFSLGVCYKRCAILTENKFPYRAGAASCCRYNDHLACLDALNVNSSSTFSVGGGLGDGHNSTPGSPHWPIATITEVA